MNIEWVSKAAICDKLPIFEDLKVIPFNNQHETKWAVLPKCVSYWAPWYHMVLGLYHMVLGLYHMATCPIWYRLRTKPY